MDPRNINFVSKSLLITTDFVIWSAVSILCNWLVERGKWSKAIGGLSLLFTQNNNFFNIKDDFSNWAVGYKSQLCAIVVPLPLIADSEKTFLG